MSTICRREFLKRSGMGLLGLTALDSLKWSPVISALVPELMMGDKPNVLFIAIDDMNDWIDCFGGYPGVITPNFNRLAERGMIFTKAFCPAPACNPSRASVLSGIRPSTSGVYINQQDWRVAMPNIVTLPRYFKNNGYYVAGASKIFHDKYPDTDAWHEYFPRPRFLVPSNKPLTGITGTYQWFDWGPLDADDEDMQDYKVAQWIIEFLERKHEIPFFLACGFCEPHLPWYAPRKYFEMYPLRDIVLPLVRANDLDDVPQIARTWANPTAYQELVLKTHSWETGVQACLAIYTFLDVQLGRVLDALDKSLYANNTIIVLWSDNGHHLGEKMTWMKGKLWSESTQVPFMIDAPGVSISGEKCGKPVNLIDIYPTLIELCGLAPKKELEGESLVPLLKNPRAVWEKPSVMTYFRNNHAVCSERYLYIRYNDGSEELYDHWFDPYEWENLAGKPPFAKIKNELKRWLPAYNAPDAPITM